MSFSPFSARRREITFDALLRWRRLSLSLVSSSLLALCARTDADGYALNGIYRREI